MRDILSKLDAIISETSLRDKQDLDAKRQALDDLEADPVASTDPEISAAIDQRRADLEKEAKSKGIASESTDLDESIFEIGDEFGISFSEDHEILGVITDLAEDGIVISLDDAAMEMMESQGVRFLEDDLIESKIKGKDGKACWKGYRYAGTKMKGGRQVDNCVPVKESKSSVNFTPDDIAKLQTIDDIESMKSQAFELISKPSKRPMKPEKVEWFRNALEKMQNKTAVIKLMYDLMLSGEGHGVVGSKSSMSANTYRQRFNDDIDSDIDEYFQFEFPKGKDRGPRDHGTDELERREKTMGKGGLAKDARDYKEKD